MNPETVSRGVGQDRTVLPFLASFFLSSSASSAQACAIFQKPFPMRWSARAAGQFPALLRMVLIFGYLIYWIAPLDERPLN
jgi:hypothetical protein